MVKTADKCLRMMQMTTDYIRAIENPFAIEVADVEAEKASGLIEVIGDAIDAEYLKEVKDVNINQN